MIFTTSAGNTTCFTTKKYELDEIPEGFKAEQYATYEVREDQVEVKMYGDEFSGGGTMAGALLADTKFVDVDCAGNNVICEKLPNDFIKATFPKALVEYVSYLDKGIIKVKMNGITHLITDRKDFLENGEFKELVNNQNDGCVGVLYFNDGEYIPRIYIKSVGTTVFEQACTSGSLAIAEVFGIKEIKQPSGEIIKIKKEGNYIVTAKCKILNKN